MNGDTTLTIANKALAVIGSRWAIASLTENSAEAAAVNLFYTSARDQLLAAAQWGFAKRSAPLTLLKADASTPQSTWSGAQMWDGSTPVPPWLYEYAVPSDCLQILSLTPQPYIYNGPPIFPAVTGISPMISGVVRYERGDDLISNGAMPPVMFDTPVIYCNQPYVICNYNRQVTTEGEWDPWFVEAFVQGLASKICMTISGKVDLQKACEDRANQMIMKARERDSNQNLQVVDSVPDWMRIRGVPNYQGWGAFGITYGPLFGAPL